MVWLEPVSLAPSPRYLTSRNKTRPSHQHVSKLRYTAAIKPGQRSGKRITGEPLLKVNRRGALAKPCAI